MDSLPTSSLPLSLAFPRLQGKEIAIRFPVNGGETRTGLESCIDTYRIVKVKYLQAGRRAIAGIVSGRLQVNQSRLSARLRTEKPSMLPDGPHYPVPSLDKIFRQMPAAEIRLILIFRERSPAFTYGTAALSISVRNRRSPRAYADNAC